jgi:putative CRISPR-associated protein (TIGR02619 family)
MPRLVISTVGTSLLTNQIDLDLDPDDWSKQLEKTANYTTDEINKYHQGIGKIIEKLKQRAEEKLYDDDTDIEEIREASAELNGIYGLYDKELERGMSDTHLLIATDTAQGKVTAGILESFLKSQGISNTSICIQPGLCIANSDIFVEGMAKLIPYIQSTIVDCQNSQYDICFNLVGGFKALQGYFNTIGMFYANEIIYVFEGSNEVIKIPKLPVKVDVLKVEPYKVQLAMMDVGEIPMSWEETKKVPKEWVIIDAQEMTLSTWGKLIWNNCKDELLSKEKPLKFDKIEYTDYFHNDYKSKQSHEKVTLQENLARAACLLKKHKDGISAMKEDGIFRLRRYKGKHKDIDHFDLPKDRRVSCIAKEGTLYLRHYGEHNYVNDNP